MKRLSIFATRSWMLGVSLALSGVVIARVLAPLFGGRWRAGITGGGELVALGGLAIVALGIRSRVRRAGFAMEENSKSP